MSRSIAKYLADYEDPEEDFCKHYQLNGRDVVYLNASYELYDNILDEKNALVFKGVVGKDMNEYSFVMLHRTDDTEGGVKSSGKRGRDTDEMWDQVHQIINDNFEKICRGYIVKNTIDKALASKYIFVVTKHDDFENYKKCNIISFQGVKDPEMDYLIRQKAIESVVICSAEYTRNLTVDGGMRMLKLNASFGSFLTYQAAMFTASRGYNYYFIRAADYGLVKMYMDWGFHFGLPHLNLDELYKLSLKTHPILNEVMTIHNDQQIEDLVKAEVQAEISKRFQVDHNLIKLVWEMPLEEWMDKKSMGYEFKPEAYNVARLLTRFSTFGMYINLHNSEDMGKLERYSKSRLTSFFDN